MLPVQSGVKQQCPASCVCALWQSHWHLQQQNASSSSCLLSPSRARSSADEPESAAALLTPQRPAGSASGCYGSAPPPPQPPSAPSRPALEQLHPFLLYYEQLVHAARLEQRGAFCLLVALSVIKAFAYSLLPFLSALTLFSCCSISISLITSASMLCYLFCFTLLIFHFIFIVLNVRITR